jgi:hypothetical protein
MGDFDYYISAAESTMSAFLQVSHYFSLLSLTLEQDSHLSGAPFYATLHAAQNLRFEHSDDASVTATLSFWTSVLTLAR